MQKLVQSGSSVMFIAIDMDKLKQINDTLGHQEGDLAITLLAQAIKQSIRKVIMPSDSVAMNSASFLSIRRRKLQHNCLNVSKTSATYRAAERDRLLFRYLRDERKRYVT